MPTISIALATFNGARFLGQQLDSLAAQSRLPDELVICDDRSADNTADIVRAFAKTAPFPVVLEINETRLGYKSNFMKAAGLCQSDLISFCDQDDVWKSDKLALMEPLFADPDVLLAYHNSTLVDTDLKRTGAFYETPPMIVNSPACGRPWWNPNGFTQIFRSSLLKHSSWRERAPSYENDDIPLAHDQWVMFLAWAMGKISYHHGELVSYRQHGANLYGQRAVRFSQRVRFILEDRTASYNRMAVVCQSFASLLLEIASDEVPLLRERAQVTAVSLKQLALYYADRAEACGGKTIAKRLSAYNRLRHAGLYSEDIGWSFGRKALLKDLALGVTVGRLGTSLRRSRALTDIIVSRRPERPGAPGVSLSTADCRGYANV